MNELDFGCCSINLGVNVVIVVEYEDHVKYTDTTDIGMDIANGEMCQLRLSDEILFCYWGVSPLRVHFRVF